MLSEIFSIWVVQLQARANLLRASLYWLGLVYVCVCVCIHTYVCNITNMHKRKLQNFLFRVCVCTCVGAHMCMHVPLCVAHMHFRVHIGSMAHMWWSILSFWMRIPGKSCVCRGWLTDQDFRIALMWSSWDVSGPVRMTGYLQRCLTRLGSYPLPISMSYLVACD